MMFDTLLSMPLAARFFIAFLVVLALIGATAWLVRRFAANRLGGGSVRGRQPRLAVIDAANVDARRKLVLIRRDNIEHLLMIGGPSDIVIEPNIVRAGGARESAREPARDIGMRAVAPADNGWPLQPINEPPPRARAEESWDRPRAADPLNNLGNLGAEMPPPLPRREPRPPAAPAPNVAPVDQTADQNLAEMAQQLEAALRAIPDARAAEPPAPAVAAVKAPESLRAGREIKMRIDPRISDAKPQPRPEPKIERFEPRIAHPTLAEFKPEPKSHIQVERPEPKLEVKPEPKIESKIEVKPEPKSEPKPEGLTRQDFYDNLEEEMASLLGRPPAKS